MVFSWGRIKLIPDIDRAAGFGSIWVSVLGVVTMALEMANQALHFVPPQVQNLIPHSTSIAIVIFGLNIIARIFKWEKSDGESER